MQEIKWCEDCKYCIKTKSAARYWRCSNPYNLAHISGNGISRHDGDNFCSMARGRNIPEVCGPEAKFWEPRTIEQKMQEINPIKRFFVRLFS